MNTRFYRVDTLEYLGAKAIDVFPSIGDVVDLDGYSYEVHDIDVTNLRLYVK